MLLILKIHFSMQQIAYLDPLLTASPHSQSILSVSFIRTPAFRHRGTCVQKKNFDMNTPYFAYTYMYCMLYIKLACDDLFGCFVQNYRFNWCTACLFKALLNLLPIRFRFRRFIVSHTTALALILRNFGAMSTTEFFSIIR